jgi:hypothetical protein
VTSSDTAATEPSAEDAAEETDIFTQTLDTKKEVQSYLELLDELEIPLGWELPIAPEGLGVRLLGIFITSIAVSLGVDFWYKALKRLTALRENVSSKDDQEEEK